MKEKIPAGLRVLMVVVALIGLLTAYTPAGAQDTPPTTPQTQDVEAIYRAQYDALNAGDLEASLAFLAEDMVTVLLPPLPGVDAVQSGKAAVRKANEVLISLHNHVEFTDFQVNGETVNFRAVATDDSLKSIGVAYIELSGTAVVQNGLVVSETWLMSKESLARIEAAMVLENNKAILRRAYEQIFSEGKLELLDEDIAPDALDHGFPELRGVEAFKGPMAGLRAAFPDLQAKPEFIIAEGDMVMALATFTGTHQAEFLGIPATGKQITWSHVDINRIQDGKVVEAWHIGVPGAILQALGYQLTPPTE